MSSENTFYVYRIVNSEGELKHSSILYDDGAGASRSPDEIRQSLLTAAEYAIHGQTSPAASSITPAVASRL